MAGSNGNGFSVAVTHTCPYTRGSRGVVVMTPEVIANLSGAVLDRDEWMCWLLGERRDNGYTYYIDDIIAPKAQQRRSAFVEFKKCKVPQDAIGVLHSHNTMRATFSSTDVEDFNTKFLLSIVISSQIDTDESKWLGFSYTAWGKAMMPCNAPGEIDYKIMPEGVSDWPLVWTPESKAMATNSLGDCVKAHVDKETSTRYKAFHVGACGLKEDKPRVAISVFGEEDTLLKSLPKPHVNIVSTPIPKGYKGAYQAPLISYAPDSVTENYASLYNHEEEVLEKLHKAQQDLSNNPNVTVYYNNRGD